MSKHQIDNKYNIIGSEVMIFDAVACVTKAS